MKTICFTNAKGGVGKTTSAVNVAAALGRRFGSVVLIDLDQQASATASLGARQDGPTSYDVLTGEVGIDDAAALAGAPGVAVVPAGIELAAADASKGIRLDALRRALAASQFDIAVLDCPPALSLPTLCAMAASEFAVVPMRADYLSLRGIETTLGAMQRFDGLSVAGVILNEYDGRKVLCRQVLERVRARFGEDSTFTVRSCVALAEAPMEGVSVLDYAPKSNGAVDYQAVADSLAARLDL